MRVRIPPPAHLVKARSVPRKQTVLRTVLETPIGYAHIIANSVPVFSGDGNEDLLCGFCSRIVCAGASMTEVWHHFGGIQNLVLTCVCRAKNVLPLPIRKSYGRG
jgi:hypothetical protein